MDPILIGILVLAAAGILAGPLYFGVKGVFKGIRPTGWQLDTYSKNVTVDFNPKDGSILKFKFPNAYPGVHMLSKRVDGLRANSFISIAFEITGKDPNFYADGLTPELRLFLGAQRNYSLGNKNACPLKLGKQTLMVPLTAENWKTVNGYNCDYDEAHKRLFEKQVGDTSVVAFVFGDEHGNGHGAWDKNGNTEFRLLAFSP